MEYYYLDLTSHYHINTSIYIFYPLSNGLIYLRKNDIAAKLLKLVELETECQAKDNTIAALTTEIQEKSNQICNLKENNEHTLLDL